MPIETYISTALFTVALILYSIAIWSGRLAGELKAWHLIVFSLGVIIDSLAIWLTIKMVGAIVFTPHAIFGFIALALMVLHFIWAVVAFKLGRQKSQRFQQLALIVWGVWVLSYLSGFLTGIQKLF